MEFLDFQRLRARHADVYDGFDVLADDSVERALVPCPFGVEREGGIKGTCVCVLVGLKDNGLRVNWAFPQGLRGDTNCVTRQGGRGIF